MIAKLVVQTILSTAAMGMILFSAAGTVAWPAGWIFLIEMSVLGIGVGLWLAQRDPALLAERLAPLIQRDQKLWDKIFMGTILLAMCSWLALMALDAVRYEWSSVPIWLQIAGAFCVALCVAVAALTFRENSFAAPVVKIQRDRGQKVIDSGPYSYVRHPMYAGAILFFIGVPLLLGSWWGVVAAPFLIFLLGFRAVMEERTLIAGLDGYADYADRVRYRLIPLLW